MIVNKISRRFGRALFEGELGKIIERDRADDLKTFRAHLIHCVIGRVPGGKSKSIRSIVGMPTAFKGE